MKKSANNRLKTCLSMLLIMLLVIGLLEPILIEATSDFPVNGEIQYAYNNGTTAASVYSLPGTTGHEADPANKGTSQLLCKLQNGTKVIVLGEELDGDGDKWYQVSYGDSFEKKGYVFYKHVVLKYTYEYDEDFEKNLLNFPESYRDSLRSLHAKYPNWIFIAHKTGYNWSDVIAAESKLAVNLVHADAPSSWKSTQTGAYDWTSGEWKEFDSGGWVAASTEVVQHFMDPRNFLDSTNIFQFIKQSYDSTTLSATQLAQKKSDLTNMVQGTYLAGACPGSNKSYVDIIMDAAAKSEVCPFTLASMMIQEQGKNGTGSSISGTYPGYAGYYNYLNIGAYKTSTMAAVERGLWYAKGSGQGLTTYNRPWNNREASIIGGSRYYGEHFVSVGQDTLYLKKYNIVKNSKGELVASHQYMTNVQGAYSEGIHMAEAYDDNARKTPLIFKIPVYNNMPEKACTKPTGDGNPNYMLKSLSVSGYSLTPTFSMYDTTYSLIVANSVSEITVSAQAYTSTASISGTGKHSLKEGSNSIQVVVTAGNGAKRTYTIQVVRQAATVPTPTVSASSASGYKINANNTITGIAKFPITVSNFRKNFTVTNGTMKITTSSGVAKSDTAKIGTGDQIRLCDKDGVHKVTQNVLIYGDTNGDGDVSVLDLLRVQKDILKISKLSGYYQSAGDTSKNGTIDALDLLQVQKHILKIKSVSQ